MTFDNLFLVSKINKSNYNRFSFKLTSTLLYKSIKVMSCKYFNRITKILTIVHIFCKNTNYDLYLNCTSLKMSLVVNVLVARTLFFMDFKNI